MAILQGIKLKDDETVHQLDYESGIGKKPTLVKSWDDLEDKPFEVVGLTEVDILATEEISAEYVADIGMAMGNHENILGLKEGETYFVTYDGVKYELVCKMSDGACFIGNSAFAMLEDTGEPFCIADIVDANMWSLMTTDTETTTHTIRIYQGSEDVKMLDPKFVDAYTKEETMNLIASSITSTLNTEV